MKPFLSPHASSAPSAPSAPSTSSASSASASVLTPFYDDEIIIMDAKMLLEEVDKCIYYRL